MEHASVKIRNGEVCTREEDMLTNRQREEDCLLDDCRTSEKHQTTVRRKRQ